MLEDKMTIISNQLGVIITNQTSLSRKANSNHAKLSGKIDTMQADISFIRERVAVIEAVDTERKRLSKI